MIYKFKSPATGDLVMLADTGDRLLRAIGREPSARGIIEVEAMPAAIAAIDAAIEADEAARRGASAPDDEPEARAEAAPGALPLRRRFWPMVQMLERAHAARESVVWGV
jgi:hypothetical protein